MKSKKIEKTVRILELLEPTREQVIHRHAGLLDAFVNNPTQAVRSDRRMVELCRGFVVRLTDGVKEIGAGFAQLQTDFELIGRSGSAVSAKGFGSRVESSESSVLPLTREFNCSGNACTGALRVTDQRDGNLCLLFSMEDGNGLPIRPFFLTVEEDGQRVLSRKRIDLDAYQVPDVSPASLRFTIEDENKTRRVVIGWDIVTN